MGRYNNRLDGVCKLMKIIQKNNFSKNEWKVDGLSDNDKMEIKVSIEAIINSESRKEEYKLKEILKRSICDYLYEISLMYGEEE